MQSACSCTVYVIVKAGGLGNYAWAGHPDRFAHLRGFTDAQMNDLRRAFQKNKKEETDRTALRVATCCCCNMLQHLVISDQPQHA